MAVTLEVSSLHYFPWVIAAARKAIAERSLMPGRWIRVRKMKEQEADGDLPAVAAAMQIIGASVVETLDTKGTDGSNIHLGGPATITGYFGGIGQPNDHALQWVDEFLHYYTEYGVRQVLNVNPGTVLAGYLLHRLGVDIEFKISVFVGNDNPFAGLWTLLGARLFARDDGSGAAGGVQLGQLGEQRDPRDHRPGSPGARPRGCRPLRAPRHRDLEEHRPAALRPPRRAGRPGAHVPNISAKHEGGDPAVDAARPHPSDILDYFRDKAEIIASGDWDNLQLNFMDKLDATNHTARALTEHGLSFVAARNLHREAGADTSDGEGRAATRDARPVGAVAGA